ncbi:hypothetical protein pSalSNUABM01_146 [Salmonella phage pSal-SNUABM-01]|nr:hypothetical protein pSalSNUABM01_146 [Salmonella phage pSal-SNUABM-01]
MTVRDGCSRFSIAKESNKSTTLRALVLAVADGGSSSSISLKWDSSPM